jgi:hypothetical protein
MKEEVTGENCIMGSSIICTVKQILFQDGQIRRDEMGNAYRKYEVMNAYKILVKKKKLKRTFWY